MLCPAFLLSSLLLLGAQAQFQVHGDDFKPDFELEATTGELDIDCQKRLSVLINGQSPGPQLNMTEGKVTWVRVWNKMSDLNLTMHWHGLSQRAAPFSDGTPLVSQWPIPPGHFFDYEVRPEPGDAGTYFYHSHVGFQLITAHGPLIVQDPNLEQAEQEYGEDVVMMLADYYAKDDHTIESGLLADPFRWSGEPQAVLVQGHSGKANFGSGNPSCEPYVIDVEPGKMYRLRMIGATAISVVKLGIEDHSNLTVIEADGSYTEPTEIDHMQLAPGQRFSYRLQAKSAAEIDRMNKTEFWVRYESRERPESIQGYALLRYRMDKCEKPPRPKSQLPDKSPIELSTTTNDYLEYQLQPASQQERQKFPRLSEVTRTVTIQINQMLTSGEYVDGKLQGSLVWVQNGSPWKEDVQAEANQMPYLITVYTANEADNVTMPNYERALENGGFDSETKTFPARVGEVLDIVWQNNGGITGNFDIHPMHIHGEHAWDLGSGSGTYKAEENEKRFEGFTPARRDTTILYRYTEKDAPDTTNGWRAWRIRVTEDNVGAWMMHCHIAQHAAMGMNTVWIFGDTPALMSRFPTAPFTEGYLKFGGEAYGSADKSPVVNHHFGQDEAEEKKAEEEQKTAEEAPPEPPTELDNANEFDVDGEKTKRTQ
ncbi:hypothetical protein XA68_17294 [Ophiocordyceps unilateralis]|uniref:L-ascorbate oxidase n=1 Tax=Ophiocordyceps unilateralis TaxID=268505 RepID=A0A2A9PKQ0_OPHUN|nr:hypothetical protein XA68_17294 [Ophiocordyceps unilateralis]